MSYLKQLIRSKFIANSLYQFRNVQNSQTKKIVLKSALREASRDNMTHFKLFLFLTTGYLSYKASKKISFIPAVNAATSFGASPLAGRRKQFNFIADVVETSASAVVYIEIKDSRKVDFFTGKPRTISNGSGFIIEENGLILTNAHVVTNKPNVKVEVKLVDGSIYDGIVEDIDLVSDLATVRIPAKKLPVMKLGSSADLKPGEFVVAIGSPLALSNTVTSGVVSSTQRGSAELGLIGRDMNYIQTDAAITFGNSGGPLVNLDGEAIGVNSMKVTAGISFAIPIDYVKEFLKTTKGPKKSIDKPKRLYMGVTMLTLTPQIINELQQRDHKIPRDIEMGVLIWKVIYGSPAHNGGLRPGDIVTHIDGKRIQHSNDVYGILAQSKSRELNISINRSGKNINVTVIPEDFS